MALVTAKIPAMKEVASTDLVIKNTQYVTANQTKALVTEAIRELVRML